jgi:pyrimidine operon attenuation protein/uracil phosphoribosyltransferase
MTFGRPQSVEFLTLIERRFVQNLPIRADYIGKSIDTIKEEKVTVLWEGRTWERPNIIVFTNLNMKELSISHLLGN